LGFQINDNTTLSSVFYGSGDVVEELKYRKTPFSYKTANGLVPFDEFVKYNTGQPNTGTPLTAGLMVNI
jgi:hypothetical protein